MNTLYNNLMHDEHPVQYPDARWTPCAIFLCPMNTLYNSLMSDEHPV